MAKSYKGGYKLISLEKVDFLELEVGVVIKGIHAKLEATYGKPLLLEDIVIDGVEKNAIYIKELKVVDGAFVFEAYGYTITITDEDEVEAVEIHVPVVKSVTSSAETKEIDIQEGDEYLLSSTNENGTVFDLPSECYLVGDLEYLAVGGGSIISGFQSHVGDDTQLTVMKSMEVYIKRIGNMILVSASYAI